MELGERGAGTGALNAPSPTPAVTIDPLHTGKLRCSSNQTAAGQGARYAVPFAALQG